MEDLDFMKYQRKLNTLMGMPLYVYPASTLKKTTKGLLMTSYQIFSELILLIVTIGQFLAIPHVFEDMNVLCGCLSSSAHCFQLIAKTTFLRIYKNRYSIHLRESHELQREINKFEKLVFQKNFLGFEEYHLKKTRYVRIISTVQLIVNFVSTSAYFLPFVYDSIINHHDLHRQMTPIVVYFGTNINFTPLFQIIVFTLFLGFLLGNLKTVVMDNFILHIIVLHMSQLKYHQYVLKEVQESQKMNAQESEEDREIIKIWIRQHQTMLSLCKNFRKLVSPYLFFEFSYVIIHTCLPAFVITSTFSWTLPQKISVFFMVSGSIVTLFLMSDAGDSFCIAWQNTRNILFNFDLFRKNKNLLKSTYFFVHRRLQLSFHLNALNIIPLNCSTFVMILRLIVSYYMTLSEIQKIKRNIST